MRQEIIEYAKTVYMDTPLTEIQKHVRDMDEFKYVFEQAKKNGRQREENFPFNNEFEIAEKLKALAKEKFKGRDLTNLKTSTVQKELRVGYSIAWRLKEYLKNENNL